MVFGIKPADIGLHPSAQAGNVWGFIIESGYSEAVTTLGGGIIGLGQHEGPQRALKVPLAAAPQFATHFQRANGQPLTRRAHTRIYLPASTETLATEVAEEMLRNGTDELFPLFIKRHELTTDARLVDEKRRAEQSVQGPAENS